MYTLHTQTEIINEIKMIQMRKIPLIFALYGLLYTATANAQSGNRTYGDMFGKLKFDIGGGRNLLLGSTGDAENYLTGIGVSRSAAVTYYDTFVEGTMFSADLHYLFFGKYGCGIAYQLNNNRSAIPGLVEVTDNNYNYYGRISENVIINYLGLSFLMTEPLSANERFLYKLKGSVGPVFYRNEYHFVVSKMLITSASLGMSMSGALEYRLTGKLALGAGLNLFGSTLTNVNMQLAADEQATNTEVREALHRVGWMVYLAFNL